MSINPCQLFNRKKTFAPSKVRDEDKIDEAMIEIEETHFDEINDKEKNYREDS